MIDGFSSGITKSSTPIDEPERVECSNPRYMSLSANITVSFKPAFLYEISIKFETDFLSNVLLTLSKPTSIGAILQTNTLPTVVSSKNVPLSALVILTLIFACMSTVSDSYALNTSSGLLNTLPSPLTFTLSRVM